MDIPPRFLEQIQLAWLDAAKHVKEHGGPVELSVKVYRQEKDSPICTVISSTTKHYRS